VQDACGRCARLWPAPALVKLHVVRGFRKTPSVNMAVTSVWCPTYRRRITGWRSASRPGLVFHERLQPSSLAGQAPIRNSRASRPIMHGRPPPRTGGASLISRASPSAPAAFLFAAFCGTLVGTSWLRFLPQPLPQGSFRAAVGPVPRPGPSNGPESSSWRLKPAGRPAAGQETASGRGLRRKKSQPAACFRPVQGAG
jgi:hypothetical protein